MTYRSLISEVCRIHYHVAGKEGKRGSTPHTYLFISDVGASKFLLLRVVDAAAVFDAFAAVDLMFVVMQKASQSSH